MFEYRWALLSCIFIATGIANALNIDCPLPSKIDVEFLNQRTRIEKPKIDIHVEDKELEAISYKGAHSLELQSRSVKIAFTGYSKVQNALPNSNLKSENISIVYYDRMSGIARPTNSHIVNESGYDCRVILLPSQEQMRGPSVHHRIMKEIRRLSELCVEREVCRRVAEITVSKGAGLTGIRRANWMDNEIPYSDLSGTQLTEFEYERATCDSEVVQVLINKIADVALDMVVSQFSEENGGTVTLPDFQIPYNDGMLTTGEIEASDGTFRDFTTVRRRSDAILGHHGLKFYGGCSFGLSVVDIKYNHYKLRYGYIKVSGEISGSVDNAVVAVNISADYTQRPCVLQVEQLNVVELGKINVQLTGLSFLLNWLGSTIAGWIATSWREEIIDAVDENLLNLVQSQLSALDCEIFRP